ncbi:MAG: hypothetical protein MJ073_03825 [Oscillibacter sp.]|nr:hypothetical protein [Oscillibacter sp.]
MVRFSVTHQTGLLVRNSPQVISPPHHGQSIGERFSSVAFLSPAGHSTGSSIPTIIGF